MRAGSIQVKNLVKSFKHDGVKQLVLDNISLNVEAGSFTTVVGPSGCGKSTLLNIIAGIEPADSGEVKIRTGRIIEEDVKIGYVFQAPRLLPWLNVFENVRFVHKGKDSWKDADKLAKKYLEMVGLLHVANKYPHQLSGGMQQRAGIARALSLEPSVLLMDEPFSHLDAITAAKLRDELLMIWRETGVTIFFVTHDILEAIYLSDRIITFTAGPARIYRDFPVSLPRPRSLEEAEVLRFYSDVVRDFKNLETLVATPPIEAERTRKRGFFMRRTEA